MALIVDEKKLGQAIADGIMNRLPESKALLDKILAEQTVRVNIVGQSVTATITFERTPQP